MDPRGAPTAGNLAVEATRTELCAASEVASTVVDGLDHGRDVGGSSIERDLPREAQRNLEVLIGRYPRSWGSRRFCRRRHQCRRGCPRPCSSAGRTSSCISLTLGGGRLSDQLLSVLELNPWLLHAMIGLEVPIYTGGALTARIEIATAHQAEAVARYGAVAA